MRGHWADDQTFMVEWTQPGNTGSLEIWLKYSGDHLEIAVQPVIFGGEPAVIKGSK